MYIRHKEKYCEMKDKLMENTLTEAKKQTNGKYINSKITWNKAVRITMYSLSSIWRRGKKCRQFSSVQLSCSVLSNSL